MNRLHELQVGDRVKVQVNGFNNNWLIGIVEHIYIKSKFKYADVQFENGFRGNFKPNELSLVYDEQEYEIENDINETTAIPVTESTLATSESNLVVKCSNRADIIWKVKKSNTIGIDRNIIIHDQPTQIRWPDDMLTTSINGEEKSIEKYFELMFPMQYIESILNVTNIVMKSRDNNFVLTKGRLFKYFGICLAIALNPMHGELENYWIKDDTPGKHLFAPNYGENFEMSWTEFRLIKECLTLSSSSLHIISTQSTDVFHPIRPFVDAFNERRFQVIHPGSTITVDQCMCAWKGQHINIITENGISITKAVDKQDDTSSVNVNAAADCEIGVLLKLELDEGILSNNVLQFQDDIHKYPINTAALLRLTQSWFTSNRIVYANSNFSSIKTAIAVEKFGNHFIGSVKSDKDGYPIDAAIDFNIHNHNEECGIHKAFTTTIDDIEYMNVQQQTKHILLTAIAWISKPGILTNIIATTGSIVTGNPLVLNKTKHRVTMNGIVNETEFTSISQPKVIEEYFKYIKTIDTHDRLRQGVLNWSRYYREEEWYQRLFMDILGSIVTDAYLVYRHDKLSISLNTQQQHVPIPPFHSFVSQLSHNLIFNELDMQQDGTMYIPMNHHNEHTLCRLKFHDSFSMKRQRVSEKISKPVYQRICIQCKASTSYYCSGCIPKNTKSPTVNLCSRGLKRCFKIYHQAMGISLQQQHE